MGKRRRTIHDVDTELVEIYEDLANESNEVRLKAAKTLCMKYSPQDAIGIDKVTEISRRLIRGLCSGRKAARLGFSIALTEYLTQITRGQAGESENQITVDKLVDLVESQTNNAGSVAGQEQRDHCFGRLFACEAVIKSCLLQEAAWITKHQWARVLDMVIELAKSKVWLREECGFLLYRTLPILCKLHKDFAQVLVDKSLDPEIGLSGTSEGVSIWLVAQDPSSNLKLPKKTWHHQDVLNCKEIVRLKQILGESSKQSESSTMPGHKSVWRPQVHFVWDAILSCLLDVTRERKHKSLNFGAFWKAAVDQNLFSNSSSPERKYLGFLIFQSALDRVPESFLDPLFSQNFMKCFINQLAAEDRFLHQMAIKSASSIVEHVRRQPSHALQILKALIMPPSGLVNLDQVAKVKIKIIPAILEKIPQQDFLALFEIYRSLLFQPGVEDEKAASFRRQNILDQLSGVIKSCQRISTGSSDDGIPLRTFVNKTLGLFALISYFKESTAFVAMKPALSHRTQQDSRVRLTACLSHLLKTASDPSYFPSRAIDKIIEYEESTADWEPVVKTNAQVKSAYATMKDMQGSNAENAFRLLYSLTLLEVYNEDDDAIGLLEDLERCFRDLQKSSKEAGKEATDQKSSDALTEIILSFVARPSLLYRRMAQQVFPTFASDLTASGMQSFFRILDTKESLAGQAEIFQGKGDEENSAVSSDDSVEMLDDLSTPNGARESTDTATSEDPSSDNDASDESEGGEDAELAAFDAKLAQALGTKPLRSLDGSQGNRQNGVLSTDSPDSDSDMSDSQMQALDDHLSSMFRERKANIKVNKSKKVEKRDAKDTIINFKTRVLELIEIYVKTEPVSSIALSALVPLLRSIRITQSPQVSKRASEVMHRYSDASKSVKKSDVSTATIAHLEAVHAEAMIDGSKAFGAACSQASLIVARVMKEQGAAMESIVQVYSDTIKRDWTDPKSKIRPEFFQNGRQWYKAYQNDG